MNRTVDIDIFDAAVRCWLIATIGFIVVWRLL
jgi:hypothetical protein